MLLTYYWVLCPSTVESSCYLHITKSFSCWIKLCTYTLSRPLSFSCWIKLLTFLILLLWTWFSWWRLKNQHRLIGTLKKISRKHVLITDAFLQNSNQIRKTGGKSNNDICLSWLLFLLLREGSRSTRKFHLSWAETRRVIKLIKSQFKLLQVFNWSQAGQGKGKEVEWRLWLQTLKLILSEHRTAACSALPNCLPSPLPVCKLFWCSSWLSMQRSLCCKTYLSTCCCVCCTFCTATFCISGWTEHHAWCYSNVVWHRLWKADNHKWLKKTKKINTFLTTWLV